MLKELVAGDVYVPKLSPYWRASEIGRDCEAVFSAHVGVNPE